EADERMRPTNRQAAGAPWQLGDMFSAAGGWVDVHELTGAGFQEPEPPVMPARGMRHGEASAEDLATLHFHQTAALRFTGSPATRRVGLTESGDVPGLAIDECQAFQVAAVFGRE